MLRSMLLIVALFSATLFVAGCSSETSEPAGAATNSASEEGGSGTDDAGSGTQEDSSDNGSATN